MGHKLPQPVPYGSIKPPPPPPPPLKRYTIIIKLQS